MEKEKKYYSDDEHDYHLHLTEKMMAELHTLGELEIMVEEGEERMVIKLTYGDQEMKEEEIKQEFENIVAKILKK